MVRPNIKPGAKPLCMDIQKQKKQMLLRKIYKRAFTVLKRDKMGLFIDSLTVMLFSLGISALMLAIYVYRIALLKKNASALALPIIGFGVFNVASGFMMSFTWPLPGSYNMLFGDPLLMLGILMTIGGYMLLKGMDIKILSVIGFFLGIYVLVGSIGMVSYGLETGLDMLLAMGLYIFAGLAGVFSPIICMNSKGSGRYAFYFLVFLLVMTALIALFIGYNGFYEHLHAFGKYFPA